MSKRTTDIVAYFTIIGFALAWFAGDREQSKFHMNQGLVLSLVSIGLSVLYQIASGILALACIASIAVVPIIVLGAVRALVTFVLLALMIYGIVNAVQGIERTLPIIGRMTLYR